MTEFKDFLTPIINTQDYSVTPLAGDASTRRYYRIVSNNTSWVLMEWEPFENTEDFPFLSVQEYFNNNGVRVPEIINYDKNAGLFLLEDLGDLTLERRFWEFQNQESVLPFYKKALDQLIIIHSQTFKEPKDRSCTAYQNEFSVEKLLWELNYAKKYLIEGLLGLSLTADQASALEQEFVEICESLYQSPQVICHRDFHSRNVMLAHDDLVIIDFQDARLGPPAYDLVSLFCDSYVDLNKQSTDELMKYYKDNFPHYNDLGISEDQWNHYFLLQSIQRCFKACGSFASFKMTRDDNRYLSYIAPTLNHVIDLLPLWKKQSLLEKLLLDSKEKWTSL